MGKLRERLSVPHYLLVIRYFISIPRTSVHNNVISRDKIKNGFVDLKSLLKTVSLKGVFILTQYCLCIKIVWRKGAARIQHFPTGQRAIPTTHKLLTNQRQLKEINLTRALICVQVL